LALAELANVAYAYPPLAPGLPSPVVLRDVSLRVEAGEFVALMGRTGAGKSTLCMCLNGVVPQSTGGRLTGAISVLGHDPRQVPTARLAREVALVYQDAECQLIMPTVEEEVAFGPGNLGIDRAEIAERVAWALRLVGIEELCHRPPSQLSGGQMQRVAIAANLAMLPRLLILDEPFAGLDPAGRRQVANAICRLRAEREIAVLLATTNAEIAAETADRIAILDDGCIALDSPPADAFAHTEIIAKTGVGRPSVTELAAALNRELGTAYAWTTLPQARDDLERLLLPGRPA
jgi:energy-coupling factor transporter ATP-binding protein EcfA2